MNKKRQRAASRQSPRGGDTLTAELRVARGGAGFVVDPKTDEAIWIEQNALGTALPGDVVTVKVNASRRPSAKAGAAAKRGPEGTILSIAARADRCVVGTVVGTGRFIRVQPLSPAYHQEFTVPELRGAKLGDRVAMRLVRWTNPRLAPEGEIVEVIGPADRPSLDTLSIMRQHGLPEDFPSAVVMDAETVSARLAEPGRRLDLRRRYVFTCDPETARDYDDALSLGTDKDGNRVLGVHIADVSHFVTPGSALDREAARRSTSVYLVDKVVPMLPEQLSNGVCSLVPGEDRLAFSAFLTFDANGKCVARRFAKSVIRSKARFTYAQVLAVLRGKKGGGADATPKLKPAERRVIRAVGELAMQLRSNRFAAGALDMDVPEAEVKLDSDGMMTGIEMREYDESHQMVEECMVAANEAVATELWTNGIKILARLHEPPDLDRLDELRANLAALGISCGDLSNQANLARFMRKVKGTPLEGSISVMVLRSMKRAVYSSKAIGHFGLAKKFYAHFTSPIRRYPDLVLHRQLASWVAGKGGRLDPAWLEEAATRASECEQNADEAERSLVEIKKYRYLQAVFDGEMKGVENRFDAVVAKVARYGVFVDLPSLAVGGMIHISHLSNAYVRWDEAMGVLSDGRQKWEVGTKMKVRISEIDFAQRRLDFVPVIEAKVAAPKPHGNGRDARSKRTRG